MRVSDLFFYPFKSARGIGIGSAAIGLEGIAGDRRAMLVDPAGEFITQREMPDLARLIAIPLASGGLQLSMDDKGELAVALPDPQRRAQVTVWKSGVSAALAEEAVNETLSNWFGRPVRLVFFDADAHRMASGTWAGEGTPVTFADGYQVLVTTTGSLEALNANMTANGEESVGMERFRPNIVIDSDEPWAEDRWAAIEIAGIRFDLVKPCARCIITTQDQLSGSRQGANPIPAMGRIRMSADRRVPGPLFGWNATPRSEGTIRVGDAVRVVEHRPEGWAIKKR